MQILCKGRPIEKIDDDDYDGHSALHHAALSNHPKCLAFLADLGANINLQSKDGATAIHCAAARDHKACVEILLEYNARVDAVDQRNRNLLCYACHAKTSELAVIVLNTMLERKLPMAKINASTKRHRTPLRVAAENGLDIVIRKLIEAALAANDLNSLFINNPDSRKRMTPLHRAAWFGIAEVVRLLLGAGADPSVRDKNNKTALVLAYE